MTEQPIKAKDVVLALGAWMAIGLFPVPGVTVLIALCVVGAIINRDEPHNPRKENKVMEWIQLITRLAIVVAIVVTIYVLSLPRNDFD